MTADPNKTELAGFDLAGNVLSNDGFAPSQDITCVFLNVKAGQTLQLIKEVDNTLGGTATPADFVLTATPTDPAGPALEFATGDTKNVLAGEWTIGEEDVDGYGLTGISCVVDGGAPVDLTDGELTIGATDRTTVCTLSNRSLPGEVTWNKVDGAGVKLSGSEWKLVGPAPATDEVAITDCVEADAADCVGPDLAPEAGEFRLAGLAWGEYTLVETKAPAGYKLLAEDAIDPFTISSAALNVSLDDIVNEQRPVPLIPLTGGLGQDAFFIGGGALIALVVGLTVPWYRRRTFATAAIEPPAEPKASS